MLLRHSHRQYMRPEAPLGMLVPTHGACRRRSRGKSGCPICMRRADDTMGHVLMEEVDSDLWMFLLGSKRIDRRVYL